MQANIELREKAKHNGVNLWQVAEKLGMPDASLSRKMRHELDENTLKRALSAVDEIVAERKAGK